MKKLLSLMVAALLIVSLAACAPKTPSESGAEIRTEKTVPNGVTDPETEETSAEEPTSSLPEDFQAGIPERYRLKINVPVGWNTPLPSSPDAGKSIFFGLGALAEGQQNNHTEGTPLPKTVDLFTIEELSEYFGMPVTLAEKNTLFVMEQEDPEKYLLFDPETSKRIGNASINLTDWGDPLSAASALSFFHEGKRKFELSGRPAMISEYGTITIVVSDTVHLSTGVDFIPPGGHIDEPAEESVLIDFAQFVYARLLEKMGSE